MNTGFFIHVLTFLLFTKSVLLEENIPEAWLDQLFPPPKYDNTQRHRYGSSSCLFHYYESFHTFVSNECKQVPKNSSTSHEYLGFYDTGIQSVKENAFQTWPDTVKLRFSYNNNLKEIEPGAFSGLTKVEMLTLRKNPKLSYLRSGSLQGLDNLKEIYIRRNNIVSAKDVSRALAPSILPKLETLDLSGNSVQFIGDDDFSPMINTSVTNLNLTIMESCDIKERAFHPFKKLYRLNLGGNHLNSSVISRLVASMASDRINVKVLELNGNLLIEDTKTVLKTISLTNISSLDLSDIQFGRLIPGFFPVMPNIQFLNLTRVNVYRLSEGIIDNQVMPNLRTLILAHNLFSGVIPTMMIPTLKKLDLTANAGRLINTNFNIPSKIFSNMTSLEELILSGNDIESIKRGTLRPLSNLKYLGLRSASIHSMYNYSFDGNTNLIYLDLSNNEFGGSSSVQKDFFAGLKNLLALDLSECSISRLEPDAFNHLKNVQYLSLRGNSLTSMPPSIFKNNPNLRILDLSSNSLISWNKPIFNHLNLSKLLLYKNQLLTFTPAMVQDFAKIKTIDLNENQIDCNCDLLNSIKTAFPEKEFKSFYLFSAENVCFTSAVGGKISVEEYYNEKGARSCYVMSTEVKLGVAIGVALLVVFTVASIYYYFKWEIIYWSYRIKQHFDWLICKRYRDKMVKEEEYKFDAFISYCHEDKKFATRMVAILEGEFGFRLCLYERDFRVGDLISESVLENVAASRMTVMVLTNAFAKSQWCLWELHIAQQRLFFRTSTPDSLILIKLSKIEESLMTHTLRHLMNARIYLEWPKEYKEQKVFWQKLNSAIQRSK